MIIDFDLLENPDLPGDFFDESLKDIAKDEGKVLFMPGVSKKTGMELSSLVSMDFQTETITAGYKYPQEQAYEIVNDMTPTQEVFKWARKFYSGSSQDFVNVAKFKPFIPPSRYASNVGMETLELKMIGNGFKFLNPTRGQEMSYGKHCVKEIEENFLVYPTREQIKEGYLNGYHKEKIHAQGIRFVRTKKFTKEKYKEIESMILKETKVEIKKLPLYYRHLGIPIEVYYTKLRVIESSLQRLMPDIMIVEHPSDHFVLRCTRKQIEELMKKAVRVECPWYSCTKYYTRYYSSLKMENTTAIVVGLDFNPYSPYALDVLTSVEMKEDGIKYSRQYKGEEFYGFFKYSLKRYHSDVWFSSIFTEHTPYTRDLMYNDLAVNHFMAGEILQLKERFTMLGAPILIEPFSISRPYTGNERKSMLRYKAGVLGDVTHVPYMTSSVRVSQEYITNCEVIKVDKIVINYRNGKREVYSPFPLQGESTIEDFFRWFANIRKLGIDGVEDYDYVMEQYKKYFVLETYEYNNKVIEKCDGGLINKKTGVTTAQYMIWKVKENETRAGLLCFFVPYCIRRYPHNNMGTIIGDLLHLTLEEAIADITLVKELVKDPPWLFGALKLSNFEYGKKLVQADEELI